MCSQIKTLGIFRLVVPFNYFCAMHNTTRREMVAAQFCLVRYVTVICKCYHLCGSITNQIVLFLSYFFLFQLCCSFVICYWPFVSTRVFLSFQTLFTFAVIRNNSGRMEFHELCWLLHQLNFYFALGLAVNEQTIETVAKALRKRLRTSLMDDNRRFYSWKCRRKSKKNSNSTQECLRW